MRTRCRSSSRPTRNASTICSANADKPVIAVMSSLPVLGQTNPMAAQMGQRGQPPWAFLSELMRDFNVKQVEVTADKIPDDIKLVVLIHPKAISESTQYALDQFVLRAGKLVVFVDPLCVLARPSVEQPGRMPPVSSSTFDQLSKPCGLSINMT